MAVTRTFRGESPDERRGRRRRALLDAALEQVWAEGLQATSVRSVCARAGLISRYFYESFQNLDELLSAALAEAADELLAAGTAAAAEQVEGEASEDRLRRALDVAVGVLVDDPRRAALMAALGAGDARLQRERRGMVMRVAEAIRARPESAELDDVERRAMALYVAGGLVELTLAFLDGDLRVSRARLVDQLARLTLGAVGPGGGGLLDARWAAPVPPTARRAAR